MKTDFAKPVGDANVCEFYQKNYHDFKHGTNFEYPQKPIQGRNFETDSRDLNDVFMRPRFHQ